MVSKTSLYYYKLRHLLPILLCKVKVKKKVKLSPYQALEAYRVVRC
jgi:hypothetical protein